MKISTILLLLPALAASSAFAAEPEENITNATDKVYTFKREKPVTRVSPYSTTAYTADANGVQTLQGTPLNDFGKDTIAGFQINPSGINYVTIVRGKKKNKAEIFSIADYKLRVENLDFKKIGTPTAAAFMPDARSLLVAVDNKVYQLDTRKYIPVEIITGLPFEANDMVISPNGYFLAISNGDKVAVYNIEGRKLRKSFDAGETVADITFSNDSDDFAILTADGVLSLYNTRTFDLRKMIDNLGDATACAFNFDGKYVAVGNRTDDVTVINLLRDTDREYYPSNAGSVNDLAFIQDSENNTILAYSTPFNVQARRMPHLKPYYNKLIAEEADRRMEEWMKMMPGETMEQYRARVNEESRARQRRLFEDEAATGFAGDLLAGETMSLGSYDRANELLALNFSTMPTIYLPVPATDAVNFRNVGDLTLSDVQYGVMPDDSFEIVYANVTNRADGKTYTYNNLMRKDMSFLNSEDAISLELLQQQQMEEMKLQELREKVVAEAKNANVISDHTNISVNSKVVPDYDADGNKILNYVVSVTYNVEPGFSAEEDFGPGKYHIDESGAASSMLKIVKEAFEGDLRQYLVPGKKLKVTMLGTADATPIVRGIAYDGSYGEIENEPVYKDGQLSALSVTTRDGIHENDQLALLRAMGCRDYLERNINGFNDMNRDYRYEVNVSKDKGSEFRRITVNFTFVDAF